MQDKLAARLRNMEQSKETQHPAAWLAQLESPSFQAKRPVHSFITGREASFVLQR